MTHAIENIQPRLMQILDNAIEKFSNVLIKKSTVDTIQFIRYTLLSGLALLLDIGLLYLCTTYVGIHYIVAATFSFLMGMLVVYLGSIWWAFDTRTFSGQKKEVSIFVGVGILGLVLNGLLITFFVEFLMFSVVFAKSCTALFVFIFNFGMRKTLLFRRK